MTEKGAILIVDDEAIILMALKQELRHTYGDRFLLESALNAVEANSLIDELTADGVEIILIISDWLMPGIKGDEFLADVKSRHPDIHCIIISGHADSETISRARETLHLDAFLRKPWTRADLIAAVGSCIGLESAH